MLVLVMMLVVLSDLIAADSGAGAAGSVGSTGTSAGGTCWC